MGENLHSVSISINRQIDRNRSKDLCKEYANNPYNCCYIRRQSIFFLKAKDLNRHFKQEDIVANNHMKKRLISVIADEMEINTAIKCHFIHSKMARTKIPNTPDTGKKVEQPEPPYIAGGM